MVLCPECEQKIVINRPKIGMHTVCRNCGVALEVISLRPLELDWAEFEDEDEDDWEDDDDWDDDDDDW